VSGALPVGLSKKSIKGGPPANDPWASVPAMLRWLIDQRRKQIEEEAGRFKNVAPLYQLPKPEDGKPDGWAFEPMTPDQVAKQSALIGFSWVVYWLNKAEAALVVNELPEAIYLITQVDASLNSTRASWSAASATKVWRYVSKRRDKQKANATKPRKGKPGREELEKKRVDFVTKHGTERGVMKHLQIEFGLSLPTLRGILGN
jgi:hypothetical protein